jgi:arsenate reductase-like glutaredoxin family protein
MNVKKNELLLIYNSALLMDRQAFAYAKSLKDHQLKDIDLKQDQLTETQIMQLAQKMGIEPDELIDKKSAHYLKYYSTTDLTESSTLKALRQNPGMMKTPIAVYHDHAEIIGTPYEFIKNDMDMNVKSNDVQHNEIENK